MSERPAVPVGAAVSAGQALPAPALGAASIADFARPDAPTAHPTVGELGERATLARIIARLPAASATLLGPGDDAAVVAAPDGRFVVTTDTMIEGPDFRAAWTAPFDLGWKAAATNLADVAAMGAVPTGLVVAVAVPPETPAATLEGLADGFAAACAALAPGCGVVGGDLASAPVVMVAVTAFGDLEGRAPVTRGGAQAGDTVAVAGALGLAGHGLALLFADGVDAAGQADAALGRAVAAAHPDLVGAQLRPHPPVDAGSLAALAGATAMLDVSDGLLLDAERIALASGVRFLLDGSALGEGEARRFALTTGEDHALLACFPPGELPAPFRAIGRVDAGEPAVLVDGEPIAAAGWDSSASA